MSHPVLFFMMFTVASTESCRSPTPVKSDGIAANAVMLGKHLPSTASREHEQQLVQLDRLATAAPVGDTGDTGVQVHSPGVEGMWK